VAVRSMPGRYNRTRFLKSVPNLAGAPADRGFEVAFAGRSNAGKSSAINAITGIGSLARTSKTPGRTQHLVFFEVDGQRRLVDLPGYGYARVAEQIKRQWQRTMEDYLRKRQSLQGLVLVMDIRHPLTEYDQQMLSWCQHAELPVHVLLTKADKLSRGAAAGTLHKVSRSLDQHGLEASIQVFSGLKRTGTDQAEGVLDRWLRMAERSAEETTPR
jgi:GTP-binding protein